MPIPFQLDYVIEKTLKEDTPERRMIHTLAGVKLSSREAKTAWNRVLEHKWYISERLGRDVGFRVAAIDFFENIYTRRESNSNSRRLANWVRRAPQAMQTIA